MSRVNPPEPVLRDDFVSFSNLESRRSLNGLLWGVTGSIITGWLLGAAGLSFAWLILLIVAVAVKWKSHLGHLINKTRWDEMQRTRRRRALAQSETAEWVNIIVHRWWMNSSDSFYRLIRLKIEPLLNEVKPSFVERIEMSEFTFGEQTPCVESVRCFDRVSGKRHSPSCDLLPPGFARGENQGVELEMSLLLNSEQFRMVFCARLFGKGVGVDVDVAIEKLYISGKLSVIFSMDSNSPFPHVRNVSVSFIEKPDVWFTIKVMKSLQMMEVPVLKTWLHSIVIDALESAMVNPGQLSFHPSGVKLDAPTPEEEDQNTALAQGVLLVTLSSVPDYISDGEQKWMKLRIGEQLWCTSVITPCWAETPHFLVHSLQRDKLIVKLKSKRLVTATTLAQYEMPLEDYNLETSQSVETHLQKRNPRLSQIPNISLRLEYISLPFLNYEGSSPDVPPISVSGVITIVVHGATNLSSSDVALCNPYCIILNSRKKVKSTPYKRNTVHPQWQTRCQLLVSDYTQTSLSFVVSSWNLKKMADDEMIGVAVFNFTKDDIWVTNKEIPLSGSPGAFLRVSIYFQAVTGMSEETQVTRDDSLTAKRNSSSWMNQAKNFLGRGDQDIQSSSDITNILTSGMGLMEVTLVGAKDLLAMDTNGFSDPYCELKVNSECKYKSSVKKKTLNPIWEENAIIAMPRLGETFDVMVWDHDTFGMKDFLGNVTFTLEEIRNISTQQEPSWFVLKGVRSGQVQLQVKIISEDSNYERPGMRERGSTESSPIVRRASMERSRVRLGVHVPPPTPPRTVSIPRPPAVGRDDRDSPELSLNIPKVTVTGSPNITRTNSQASSHMTVDSSPPSPNNDLANNSKPQEVSGFRSMRLKVSRSLRLRRFKSEINVRDSSKSNSAKAHEYVEEPNLNHAVSQPNINKPPAVRPTELNLCGRPDTYSGVEGRVLQAQGLHVAHVAQLYIRIKLLGCDKQGVGKTLAKSHLLPAVPNPQFQLDFQVANPEVVPRQAALLFEIRGATKEVVASRRVSLQDLLPGELKETHTWLALNNGATLEVSIGHGHVIKKKSKKLFRSWSVHRIGKI